MNTLPTDIIEQIFCFLPNPSLCCCTLVSRSWNTVATPFLYNTIILPTIQCKNIFDDTISSSDESYHLKSLVKEIHYLETYFIDHEDYRVKKLTKDATDAFKVFPNMTSMIGYEMMLEDKSSDGPLFDNISKKLFKYVRNQSAIDHMNMLCKNRRGMISLRILSQNDSSFRGFNGILEFLELFEHIHFLTVHYQEAPANPNDMFLQILHQIPSIISLHYGPGWNTDHLFDSTLYTSYPSLTGLNLEIKNLTTHHINYIVNTFEKIFYIKLVISDTNKDIIEKFMRAFVHVARVDWEWNKKESSDDTRIIIDDFWLTHFQNMISLYPTPTSDSTLYWESDDSLKVVGLYFRLDNETEERCHCSVKIYSPAPRLLDIFKTPDQAITYLIVNKYSTPIHLNTLNRLFRSLRRLYLFDTTVTAGANEEKGELVSNTGLTLISWPSMGNLDLLCRMYPNLAEIRFNNTRLNISQEDFDLNNGVYTVVIPFEKLSSIRMNFNAIPMFVKHVVITRIKENIIGKRWRYDTTKGELTERFKSVSLQQFVEYTEKPLLILNVQAIDAVYALPNEYPGDF